MKIKAFEAAVLAAGFFASCGLGAQNPVQIKPTEVRANIYMLTGQGGNIGLFNGPDGSFMVDDQFAPLTDKIIAAVESVGGETPRMLLNTHYHGDHTGGNENLGKAGTLIMSHHAVRERLARGSYLGAFDMETPPASEDALPVLTYARNLQLHINGETVHIFHVPQGHTDGDSFVVFENANVVHAGDLFFNGFFPFIDAGHGGTLRGTIAGVDELLAITDDDSAIIPGHGPLADRTALLAYREMLTTAYGRLLDLKSSGVSAAEAVKRSPLKDLEAEWGGGFLNADQWIEVVYPAVY